MEIEIMTINQKNCGDSRMVKTLIEQVSGLQEDVALLDNQIDDLSGVKANKADIAEEVITKNLTANTATVGEGTVSELHSSEVDTNKLHATETLTNNLEVNESADIANLKANNATVTGAEVTNLTATRVVALEGIEVRKSGEGVQANVVLDKDNIKAVNVVANKVVANVGEVTDVKSKNTVTDSLEVTEKTTVKDLDITGEITGLNNVDINAKSIVTPIIEADEVITGGIYTSADNKLHPTPSLDNNDYYIITLPIFTGNIILNWVDGRGNTLWSANVTGNGVDYGISWSTVSRDTIVVTDLYQYNKHLYIKTNINGDLAYSYHTTEKLGEIGIGFNGVAGWTNPQSLDDLTDEKYKHRCYELGGQVNFGNFYVPGFSVQIEAIETDKVTVEGENLVNKHTTTGSIDENLIFRATQHTFDYSESAFNGLFYEVAPFMESEQIPEGAKLIYNDNGTLKFTDSLPPHSGLQFGSLENVMANKEWFNGIEWMPETVALSGFNYSTPTIKVGNDREVATQEVQSFVDYRENATDALLDLRSAETVAKLKTTESTLQASIETERERAERVEETKQDNLVSGTNIKTVNGKDLLGSGDLEINTIPTGGTKGQILTSNGDGTTFWKTLESSYVLPIGMVIELEPNLNPNNLFIGEWVEM